MKEKILSNWRFKLISLLVGYVVWMLLVNISNPEVVRTKTVPLNVLNGSVLTRAGKTYSLQNAETVTISYQVRTRDAYKIQADDFHASVDLENLYDITGAVPVTVEVVGNRDLISGTPTARPGVVRVATENVQNKTFSLDTHEDGEPREGYEVGSITLSADAVKVSGPESEVGRISSVGISIPTSDATESFSGKASVMYYDANGNAISLSDERLTVEPKEVNYEVEMLRGKSLTLRFQTSGEPASGFNLTGIESTVRAIPVTSSDSALLNKTTELSIPASALNIEGAKEDKTFQLDLSSYLPSGISATGNTNISVTVKITATTERNFPLSANNGIALRGAKAQYRYTLTPETVTVAVRGLSTDLQNMNAASLGAYLEVGSLGEGAHLVPLHLTLPKGITATAVPEVTVTVSLPEAETKQSSESSSESATAGTTAESSSAEPRSTERQSGESGSTTATTAAATERSTGESSSNSTEEANP